MNDVQFSDGTINQHGPDPTPLRDLVRRLRPRPDIRVSIANDHDRGQGSHGMSLLVHLTHHNSYTDELRVTLFEFPVPPAAYNMRSWRRWLFDRLGQVDDHERMEFFRLVPAGREDDDVPDDECERPYAPSHGPGNDPNIVREVSTVEDAETQFTGERKDGSQRGYRNPFHLELTPEMIDDIERAERDAPIYRGDGAHATS
jgi:hypothetical protein